MYPWDMLKPCLPYLLSLAGAYAGNLLEFSLGSLERQRGEMDSAFVHFRKAYEDDPFAMPLVRIIANMRMEEGDRAGALEAYEKVIEARPDEPQIALEFGDFLGKVGKGDTLAERKREEVYGRVLEMLPGRLQPVERLIRTARERGDDDRARELLETLDIESEARAWKDVWSAGHGVGGIRDMLSAGALCQRLADEYRAAKRSLSDRDAADGF